MTKISGNFTGRATVQTSSVIPDTAGHELSLAQVEGPQKCSDPLWSDVRITYWGSADLVSGNGPQRGYWMNRHAGGETDWGTFEGKITTAGAQVTMEGAFKWTGGTGKFKGIGGGGKYKGRFTSATEVINDWDGEYQLASAKAAA
jgi:hypothetical protein